MGARRVLIVGVSTRALAESASRAGYSCRSVDAFGDLDQKSRGESVGLVRDLGRPYSAAAAVAVGEGMEASSAAYVANLENHPAAVARLARGRRLLGNSPEALARARDPGELGSVVRGAGGRVPWTLPPGGRLPAGGKWIRKPVLGGGGTGVRDHRPGAPVGPGEVVQERVDGVLASMSFAADGRRAVVLGFSQGLSGDPAFGARGYRYCGSLYPFPAEPSVRDGMAALAEALTRAFGLRGLNGLDFVVRDGEALVLELNPRYSASMELMERSGGWSVFEAHAAACGGALPRPPVAPAAVFGKAVVWARRDLVVGDTRPWVGSDDVRDVPFPGDRIRRGHPVCTVFARGTDSPACYDRLVAAARGVEHELEDAGRATSLSGEEV